jgi:hypothetical protein
MEARPPALAPLPNRPRVAGTWQYFEMPARADLHLDEPQAWRLLAAAAWLEVPSRETLREQEIEFEGRTLGSHARFGIVRNGSHLHEVEVPNGKAGQRDPLLGVVAGAPRPVQVRGRVRQGRMHLTLRAPDRDSLSRALAVAIPSEARP